MAQNASADITVAGNRTVGSLSVDAGLIRAEGSPLEPYLVLPVQIDMHNRPEDEMLVLTYLAAQLHLGDASNASTQIGSLARTDLIPGMWARSLPSGRNSHHVDLRFQLTQMAVARLESARHASSEPTTELQVSCQGAVAWMHRTWGGMRASDGPSEDLFGMQFGMHSLLSYLWTVQIGNLRVRVEPSVWITNVLPGLGMDRLRLYELEFPPRLPEGAHAAKAFDDALRALNEKRYEECVAKCRAIVSAWNRQLGSTKSQPLGAVVARELGWPDEDDRIRWLSGLWKALVDMSSVPHHLESRKGDLEVTAHEAKLHLTLVAAISEYLGAVVG